MEKDQHSDSELKKIFEMMNIAVVGMSRHDEKAANYVPRYLIERGYNVVPVNASFPEILGRKSYTKVSAIPEIVEIVVIFRPTDDVPQIVADAIKKSGVKVIWMQEGIYSKDAEQTAKEKGLEVVYNRCVMAEHMRLFEMF